MREPLRPKLQPEHAGTLLEVEDLHVHFLTSRGVVRAVEGLSFSVGRGEIVAIVGESGSGKSVSALSIMRLLPRHTGRIPQGRIIFDGRNLLDLDEEQMREIRGRDISMIFQEPMTSLNPLLTIGLQITEPLTIHLDMNEEQARARAIELLQFTALDVTIQAQILELMKNLSRTLNIALVIITHNLGVVARYADRVIVMYAARLVEQGSAEAVFHRPRHPYSMGLLRAVPRLDRARGAKLETIEGLVPNLTNAPPGCRFAPRCPFRIEICAHEPALAPTDTGGLSRCHRHEEIASGKIVWEASSAAGQQAATRGAEPLLSVRGLTKHFPVRARFRGKAAIVRAVEDVSFSIYPGETLGLVGESGCGKTTVGRLILRLEQPTAGEITFAGINLLTASPAELQTIRRKIQVIFQDPYASLNPRMTVGQIVGEPVHVYRLVPGRKAAGARVGELLGQVGLRPELAERYPHQLSGGQRQRVGIARALAMEPSFIVCDEAVSALDVSIQGQIINLLEDLQHRLGLAYLFIAHDLAVVVVVMYFGRVVEIADRDELYRNPLHPYTKALLDAAPIPDPTVEKARAPPLIGGELPSHLTPPTGCVFNTRCPFASAECRATIPPLEQKRPGHYAACIKI